MRHRLLAFVLAVTFLCLPTLSARGEAPAGASPRPTFTDVPADVWYAPYVEDCVEAGVMNGVGTRTFAPEEYLTVGECTALTARLHDVLRGGSGQLPAAPQDYGSGVFLDEQGNRVALASDVDLVLSGTDGMPVASFREELMSALRGEGKSVNQLTLVIDGTSRYEGEYTPESADSLEGYRFSVEAEDPASYFLYDLLGPCGNWGPFTPNDQWFLDACHYLAQNAGADGSTLRKGWRLPVPRSQWVELIALAVPKDMLAPIHQIEALPDTEDPTVLAFYNAGLLTGTDALGSFSGGEWNVTRAEAARLLTRVLRPELRVSYTPEPMRYSLTPLTLPEGYNGFGEKFIYNFSIDEYRAFGDYIYLEDGGFTGVMNLDGSWLISPELGYDIIAPFCGDGVAAAEKEGKWGYIDKSGTPIVPLIYGEVSHLHDGILLAVADDGGYCVFNAGGAQTSALPAASSVYDSLVVDDTTGGSIRYNKDGKMGYLNADGTVRLGAHWYDARPFSEGLAAVRDTPFLPEPGHGDDGGRYGFIDESGAVSIPFQFFHPGTPAAFHGGIVSFMRDGYLTKDGVLHSTEAFGGFPSFARFSDGYIVWFDGDTLRQGYMDEHLTPLTPDLFLEGTPMSNGQAVVRDTKGDHYILTVSQQS